MTGPWEELSRGGIEALAGALASGRLSGPYSAGALGRHLPNVGLENVLVELNRLHGAGVPPAHVAELLRAVAAERKLREATSDRLELVWTGPETTGSQSRDTSVVARELFAKAERSVVVSTYAVFLGKEVFEPLAKRMEELPELRVLLFLNVPAPGGKELDPDAVARDYFREFLKKNWPAGRQPELYYDPRSLAAKADERGVLHAKCIVVDGRIALVTSANFTEAAHARNIEAGVVVHDAAFATSLEQQFTSLVGAGALRRVHP
ncbi:MAG TPA: DISARM system phospholipase D-like protein DrmC [Thermoanaerobaculia bacterium]|nr:DISARM system phospholipase D-like protein DrmC [Thermoanaerobaculia bacterium]